MFGEKKSVWEKGEGRNILRYEPSTRDAPAEPLRCETTIYVIGEGSLLSNLWRATCQEWAGTQGKVGGASDVNFTSVL